MSKSGSSPFVTNPLAPMESARLISDLRRAAPQVSLVIGFQENTWVVPLTEGQSLIAGRDPSVEIPINDNNISRRHARFELTTGVVSVSDLGSTNGTRLNGVALTGSAVMTTGDEINMGGASITIHVRAPLGAARSAPLDLSVLTHDQFEAELESEVERAQILRRPLAVVMVRDASDAQLADTLRSRLRKVDRVAQYGDESVEILIPETHAIEARALLEPLSSSASIGIAVFPEDGTSAEALIGMCRDALLRGHSGNDIVASPTAEMSALVVASPAMKGVQETVKQVASAVIPVLIRGETGTGKEVWARAIHEKGPRAKHRLVAINCGAIPPTLAESVLFGHERGAFTGAVQGSVGVFEEANGGTVLLDEIGELTPAIQATLLRVLETKQVRRVGANREVPVDVRVIAATHRDLEAMVRAGTFRQDLLYRLNTMTLEIPPLRERPEEIGPIAERFIGMANAANNRHVKGIESEAMRLLLRYPWPGNIRELRNAMEHAVVVARSTHIQAADLPKRMRDLVANVLQADGARPESAAAAADFSGDLREGVQRYETQVILEALRAAGGNRTEAARRLQIPVRTLSHKIRQYGIKKLGFGLEPSGAEE